MSLPLPWRESAIQLMRYGVRFIDIGRTGHSERQRYRDGDEDDRASKRESLPSAPALSERRYRRLAWHMRPRGAKKSPGRNRGSSKTNGRNPASPLRLDDLSLRQKPEPVLPPFGGGQLPEHYSRRQLLANAAIASSRVAA